ncbi:MAG TPA: serine/threonine-protein kinase [Thermoanaerobaculia bacterium]|nr:serine/threonine-protein kinase [Thermoanaerobaculia bacterium]
MATFRCIRCKAEIDRDFKACPHCGEPVTEFLRRYADEPVDGKYQILERLGTGGMGEVYKVTHTFLGATRVIKVIRPQISESQDAHDRFLREAKAATKVQQPNVATLHDFSALPDGSHYMVWEYIDGENLAQRLQLSGPLPPRYAVELAIQALNGLEAIHRAGIVHRDISPENLMITREPGGEERVKIIDMGVAKVEDSTDTVTRAGVFVGKLRYASPEHLGFLAEGERIDGRADLYSMGVVLYEMLTGRAPFEATSPHEYVMLHSRDTQFKPLDLPANLPGGAELQAVLARALERDRNKRFATARDFANALEQVARTLPEISSMQTVAMPKPADTLNRSTIRTGVGDAATVRTPLPGEFTAPPTAIVARQETSSAGAFLVVGVIVLIAVAAIIYVLLRRSPESAPAPPSSEVAASFPNTPPTMPKPTASVEVVSPAPATTTTAPTTSSVPPTTTSAAPPAAAPAKKKPPVFEKPKAPEPAAPVPAPPPVSVRAYVDGGGGDSDVNDRALSDAKRHLNGVTGVAVRGSNAEMVKDLTDKLKREGVTVSDGAETVITFDATIERLGRGKKRRSAQATVTRNGRVVFRYELPAEEYRVGDTPVEAFVHVFADAIR